MEPQRESTATRPRGTSSGTTAREHSDRAPRDVLRDHSALRTTTDGVPVWTRAVTWEGHIPASIIFCTFEILSFLRFVIVEEGHKRFT